MRTLKFIIQGQQIKKDPECDFSGIVSGTKGYLYAKFSFSKEWEGCQVAAVFTCFKKGYACPLKKGMCQIPEEALQWKEFGVSVFGRKEGYMNTTNEIKISQERRKTWN